MNSPTKQLPLSPAIVLFFGVLAISFGSIFVRFAQEQAVPSLVIAAWRTGLASLVLLPLALWRQQEELRGMNRYLWFWALLSGGMLSLHFASWISSLAYTSIASSTVLVTTSAMWVGLGSPLFLKEKLSRPLKIGMVLGFSGSVVIGLADVVHWQNGRFFFANTTSQANPLLGNILALIGAITAAMYLLVGRRLRPHLSLISYTTVVYGTAAVCLLLMALLSGYPLFGYTPKAYLFLGLLALFPQLIGHSSYNWALAYLSAAFVSVAVISEPIGASLLGIVLFQEIPGWLVLAGSVLILSGIVIASRPSQEPPNRELVDEP